MEREKIKIREKVESKTSKVETDSMDIDELSEPEKKLIPEPTSCSAMGPQ